MKRPLKIAFLSLIGIVAVGLLLWMRSLASWRPVKMGEISRSYTVSFLSDDGQTAVLMTDDLNYSSILNLADGVERGWPEEAPGFAVFSRKSPELAFVFENQPGRGELRAYEVRTGQLKRVFSAPIIRKMESPNIWLAQDEKTVSVIDVKELFQWNVESGKLLHRVKLETTFFPLPQPNPIVRFALSLDGTRIIGASEGRGRIWDFQSGRVVKSWTTKDHLIPIQFSPDARVITYFPRDLRPLFSFVDTSTGKVKWELTGTFSHTFTDSGHEMVCLQKNYEIRDALTGSVKRRLDLPRQTDGQILQVTRDYIYTQNDDGEILRWRAR